MAKDLPEDRAPRLRLNRSGLRALTWGCMAVSLALLAALLAQDGLFSSDPGRPDHPDGLTTLALVLAILAFLIQILVFVFQTNAASASHRRSEELNTETHSVLRKIEADNTTTQKVLFSNFNRLLDFVISGRAAAGKRLGTGRVDPEASFDEPEGDQEEGEKPVTAADIERIVKEAVRAPERPTFEVVEERQPSAEDERIIRHLRSWPDREEAEAAVAALTELPPLALALLTRYGHQELLQRMEGGEVGLHRRRDLPSAVGYLIDAGLVKEEGKATLLTEQGRELARILPIGKSQKDHPVWFDEALAPLMRRP